jgi:hypothetical protein
MVGSVDLDGEPNALAFPMGHEPFQKLKEESFRYIIELVVSVEVHVVEDHLLKAHLKQTPRDDQRWIWPTRAEQHVSSHAWGGMARASTRKRVELSSASAAITSAGRVTPASISARRVSGETYIRSGVAVRADRSRLRIPSAFLAKCTSTWARDQPGSLDP